ncbi:MAG: invasin domain 3-containing protein [Candidatus Methanoperedens sp.]|nr:invasin domain 3-containing protein [Candidatus Methanoperedens sp.]
MQEETISIFLIFSLFLVVIIITAAFHEFWIKGRLLLNPLKPNVPCDGISNIPIKVQFVDPFGKPRKQKRDRLVELRSSSGNIQNVVVPEGKETAIAVLRSSNICGLVSLKGRSGIQKAHARVNFIGNVEELVLEISPTKIPADGISISSVVIKVKDRKGNFITSQDEWIVEMSTTLGTITNPVKISPGTFSGIAILTSGKETGIATVRATLGTLHSEKDVVIEELPERYCMNCGDPLKRDLNTCPNCKKTQISDNEIKECNSCTSIIPANAMFCDRCGAKQPV